MCTHIRLFGDVEKETERYSSLILEKFELTIESLHSINPFSFHDD